MNRKFLKFIPCVFLALSLAACSSTNTQTQSTPSNNDVDTQAPVENSENSSQEAMLGPDATDQELLDLLSDDLHMCHIWMMIILKWFRPLRRIQMNTLGKYTR